MARQAALAACLLLVGLEGCNGCGSGESVATLVRASGEVERDYAERQAQWERGRVGAHFSIGDGVRTGARAEAKLTLTGGGGLDLEPRTLIRFLAEDPGDRASQIAIETGAATIEGGQRGLVFRTSIGVARIDRGATMRVSEDGRRFDVLVGSATLERSGDEARTLARGQHVEFDIGGAVIEQTPAAARDAGPAIADAGVADAGPPAAGAVMATVQGNGVRVRRDGRWTSLEPGDRELQPGERVKLARRSSIDVTRGPERASVTGAAEVVVGAEGAPLLEAVDGRVGIDAQTTDVAVRVPGGVIVARGSEEPSRADVTVSRGAASIAVRQGSVEMRGAGRPEILHAGEEAELARSGTADLPERGPSRADFSITIGESPTVHDPSAPTAVRIRFGARCPGEGVVEISGARGRRPSAAIRGTGGSAIILANGTTRYRARCLSGGASGSTIGTGTIRVKRDSGATQLPRRPSRNVVDADGRRYTILYQNLLPELTFRWPDGPSAAAYTLNLERNGRTRPVRATSTTYTFASGEIEEGTYRLWFETNDGRRSDVTTLKIDYDNAAPAAYLREPGAGSIPSSGSVRVSGAAVEGASVSVGGTPLPLDGQRRFNASVNVPADEDALAIRIAHRQGGVHYYLRRIGGRGQ